MKFESEAELQAYCLRVLRARKITAEEEVSVGELRADIVTEDAVFELKKVLTRESLYQALGQAFVYNQVLQRKHICIVGQASTNATEYEQAMKVARAIVSNEIVVSFIETDPFWSESELCKEHDFGWLKMWLKEFLWMFGLGVCLVFFYGVLVHSASNPNLQQPNFTDFHLPWKSSN